MKERKIIVEEVAAALESMNKQAQQLQLLVNVFKVADDRWALLLKIKFDSV